MNGAEIALVVGVLILAGSVIGRATRVVPALVQLALGAALSFVPFVGAVELPPDVVLLLFLPALLWWEALQAPFRTIVRMRRAVLLQAVPLVVITTVLVALVGRVAGMPWPLALALGAILAPTDATALSAFASRLPRRVLGVLRGESLVNDGTALTIYAIAVGAAASGAAISLGTGALRFVYAYLAAIALGLVVAAVALVVRGRMRSRLLENTVGVLTPFAAYLPAEAVHASGVVAVVTAGLVSARFAPRLLAAGTRVQGDGFWQVTSFLLNGALFVLVGLQAHSVLTAASGEWAGSLLLGGAAFLVLVAARFLFGVVSTAIIRFVDRRPIQRELRAPFGQRQIGVVAGFRGAVSLAAALALPATTTGGAPLPFRSEIIAATFVVIVLTLVVQGFALPVVVRAARRTGNDPDPLEERRRAERRMLEEALAVLPSAADEARVDDAVRDAIAQDYEAALARTDDPGEADADAITAPDDGLRRLRLALIATKRAALADLAFHRRIDDDVVRSLESRLDIEELRLAEATDQEA